MKDAVTNDDLMAVLLEIRHQLANPPKDYTLDEVASALGMSTRWVRDRIRLDGAEHQRYGHVIRFTAEQVSGLRAAHAVQSPREPIATGPSKLPKGGLTNENFPLPR